MYGCAGSDKTCPKYAEKHGYLRNDLTQLPRPMLPVSQVIYRYCKWFLGWKGIYGSDFDSLWPLFAALPSRAGITRCYVFHFYFRYLFFRMVRALEQEVIIFRRRKLAKTSKTSKNNEPCHRSNMLSVIIYRVFYFQFC
jgi:hypothetical protein